MQYTRVILEVKDHVATLVLNRPDKLNALDDLMVEELKQGVDEAGAVEDVNVLVVTGAGRAFCSGGDLEAHPAARTASRTKRVEALRKSQQLILKLAELRKPVIASINGMAVGAGVDLACACDIRIASEGATFAENFVKIGVVPDFGGTYFLPRLIGVGRTCELILGGERIDAGEAQRIGLVNQVVSPDLLERSTKELARKLATSSQEAIRRAKANIYRGLTMDLGAALEAAAEDVADCLDSEESRRGLKAGLRSKGDSSE